MAQGRKRHKRGLATQVLYGLSFNNAADVAALEAAFRKSPAGSGEINRPEGFAWDLAHGVWQNEKDLDREIDQFALNWRPDKIGRLERVLLRLALFEMRYLKTPPKVAISEYLELAGEFGADAAINFINGILNAAARSQPETAAQIRSQRDR